MHGLIALYLGYAIYLVIFFRSKEKNFLGKEITIILALKLVLLTAIYLLFFSDKMTKQDRQESVQKIIIN